MNRWFIHSTNININWLVVTNQVLLHCEQNNEQMSHVTVFQSMFLSSQCEDTGHPENNVTMTAKGEDTKEVRVNGSGNFYMAVREGPFWCGEIYTEV